MATTNRPHKSSSLLKKKKKKSSRQLGRADKRLIDIGGDTRVAAVHIMSLARGCGERGHCQARLVSGDVFFILLVNVEFRKNKEKGKIYIIMLTTVASH